MKCNYRFIFYMITLLFLGACMTLIKFKHPDKATVNSKLEVDIEIDVALAADRNEFLLGILVPESWNIESNAIITYSSKDMPGGAIVNMPMRVATNQDLAQSGKSWSKEMYDKLGTCGNYEPVKWVAFITENKHDLKNHDKFSVIINYNFLTGSENLKANLAYFIGSTADGVNDDKEYYMLLTKLFETTGGSNSLIDYTLPKMCSITPEEFSWEDIVAFNFDATVTVDGKYSDLKDAEAVYLMARATIAGSSKSYVVDEISDKTLMSTAGSNKWIKYCYLREFFGILSDEKIEDVYFYLVNEDKSIVVKIPDSDDEFMIPESCKHLIK